MTWSNPVDVGNVTESTVTVTGSQLIHFKISAYNSNGETITEWQGAWYWGDKRPAVAPVALGIK